MPKDYNDNDLLDLFLKYRNDPDVVDMIEAIKDLREEVKRLKPVEQALSDEIDALEDAVEQNA